MVEGDWQKINSVNRCKALEDKVHFDVAAAWLLLASVYVQYGF